MRHSYVSSKPRALLLGVLLLVGVLVLASCSSSQPADSSNAKTDEQQTQQTDKDNKDEKTNKADKTKVRVASLKGPTSIGLVELMDKAKKGETANDYEFTIATSADEIMPGLMKGDYDIALVPANTASIMYNKSDSRVIALDINTLGVLNVVTGDSSISSFSDLAGKTVYMTGKGATPEYTMDYLLAASSLAGSVTLEFKDEPAEVVSVLSKDTDAIGVLPQPFATAATTKNDKLKSVIDLTDVWDETVSDGSQLITGVTAANKEFLYKYEDAAKDFLAEHKESVDAVNDDPKAAAPLVVEAGIIDNESVAAKAIPSCHIVCIKGNDMKESLSAYLKTLFETDSQSTGGTLPGDDFYYTK